MQTISIPGHPVVVRISFFFSSSIPFSVALLTFIQIHSMPNNTGFRSLFLPTGSTDSAIFAACVPLLTASARYGRPASVSPARSVFSPASAREEVEEEMTPMATSGGDPSPGSSAPAPLFALLSGRVDAALVVMKSRDIVLYNLRDGKLGPSELRRIHPTPTVSKKGEPALSNSSSASATCAALIPLDISYLCGVASKSSAASGDGSGVVYLRGVVGASDGRVSVFSEHGYAFGFTAHAGPVTRVEAIHLGGSSAQPREGEGGDVYSGASSLFHVTSQLGFITCGDDMRVFLWCRQAHAMQLAPRTLLGGDISSEFACVGAFTVNQPRLTRHVGIAPESTGVAPLPAQVIFLTRQSQPTGVWALPVTSTPSTAASHGKRAATTLLRPVSASTIDPRKVTALAVASTGAFCLIACGAALYRVDLCPTWATTTRRATTTAALPPPVKLPLRATSDVTEILISGRLAVVVCGHVGVVHILALGDTSSAVAVLGKHIVYGQRRVRRVTLHSRACLLSIVDDVVGSVELVQLPDVCLGPLMSETEATSPESVFASAAALGRRCKAEELLSGVDNGDSPSQRALRALAPTGVEQEQEAELLARLRVPESCSQFLHPSQAVL